MFLIKPSFKILNKPNNLNLLEYAGRLCYKTEDKVGTNTNKFLEQRINEGHESLIEHLSVSIKIICDRGVSHELVRHRIASFSQESTRYCNYKGGVTFIIPPWVNVDPGEYKDEFDIRLFCNEDFFWIRSLLENEITYQFLCTNGWIPQQARSILPNSLKTEIIITANMREWRTILKQRISQKAHPQMREIMIPILEEMWSLYPVLFNDIRVRNYKEEVMK